MVVCLHIACDYSCATAAELVGWNKRLYGFQSVKYLLSGLLTETVFWLQSMSYYGTLKAPRNLSIFNRTPF